MNCPDCSQANPEHARFCLSCGRALLPGTKPVPLSDERRLVTVLFVDVVGSTGLAAGLDAEDWKALINAAFAILTPPIYRYGGTIPQFLGDGFLALFGAPVAHEDDAARAVRAALELLEAARRYREQVRDRDAAEFAVRVGINSGPAVFGAVGTERHREFLAVGETVNVAAKLQARADPMTALIAEATRRLLPDGFELDDVGPVDVRGVGQMRAFVPRGAPAVAESETRSLSFASAMVAREDELARLAKATAEIRAGIGRVVVLLGEPGVGKSRLLREWRAVAEETGTRWIQANMPAFATGMGYWLAAEAVRAMMGLQPSASAADLDAALEQSPIAAGVDGARRHLGDLLSIALPGTEEVTQQPLSPQGRQARFIELTRAVARDAASEPLVLVLNDAHWCDPSSTALLIPLLGLHRELPLLVCVTARPDTEAPGWRLVGAAREFAGDRLTEVSLESLPSEGTAELLGNLLESRELPNELLEFVETRAEGNPLFVEEVVRMLVDSQLLSRTGGGWAFNLAGGNRIPETLQGLLAARIDRLDSEARVALRIASVLGRQFSVPVLERMLRRAA